MPPFRSPALLDHIAERKNELRVRDIVLAQPVPQQGHGAGGFAEARILPAVSTAPAVKPPNVAPLLPFDGPGPALPRPNTAKSNETRSRQHDRGLEWLEKGEIDRAIAAFNEAIHLDPKSASAYNDRGLSWWGKGDNDRAVADLDEAIRLDPKYALAYRNRGNAWKNKGDIDRAVADYSRAIQIDTKDALAYGYRGRAWKNKGDLARAIADYSRAIEIDPQNVVAYGSRGRVWQDKGDLDRAVTDYNRALEIDPKNVDAYSNRGRAWQDKGDLDRAVADYNQVIKLDPKHAYAPLWLEIADKRVVTSRLTQSAAQIDMTKWPAPVIRLFLGQLTTQAVFAAADNRDPTIKIGQICEANFYTGELALLKGANDEAVRLLRLAADGCPKDFVEWGAGNSALTMLGK